MLRSMAGWLLARDQTPSKVCQRDPAERIAQLLQLYGDLCRTANTDFYFTRIIFEVPAN